MIGIGDLAFLFVQVVPGIIDLNAGTIGGPVLWFLAVAMTPFGLPRQRSTATDHAVHGRQTETR